MTDRMSEGHDLARMDLALLALRWAREGARRSRERAPAAGRWRTRRKTPPALLARVLLDLFAVPEASPLPAWDSVAGSLAKHVAPTTFDTETGTLTVAGTSTAWVTQVRLLAEHLVQRLNEELGADTVRRIRVVKSAPYALPPRPSAMPDSSHAPQPSDPAVEAALNRQVRQLPREKAPFTLPGCAY